MIKNFNAINNQTPWYLIPESSHLTITAKTNWNNFLWNDVSAYVKHLHWNKAELDFFHNVNTIKIISAHIKTLQNVIILN